MIWPWCLRACFRNPKPDQRLQCLWQSWSWRARWLLPQHPVTPPSPSSLTISSIYEPELGTPSLKLSPTALLDTDEKDCAGPRKTDPKHSQVVAPITANGGNVKFQGYSAKQITSRWANQDFLHCIWSEFKVLARQKLTYSLGMKKFLWTTSFVTCMERVVKTQFTMHLKTCSSGLLHKTLKINQLKKINWL